MTASLYHICRQPQTSLGKVIASVMEDLTNATYPQFKIIVENSIASPLTFVCSILRSVIINVTLTYDIGQDLSEI